MTSSSERYKIIPAVFLVLIKDDKVLLQRRYNTGHQDGNYGLAAGHLEDGETLMGGLRREIKEEINIDIKAEDIKLIHVQDSISDDDLSIIKSKLLFLVQKMVRRNKKYGEK